MWDKLNIFGWKKKPRIQAVQKDVSVTLTNGDRQETIHRSPSGTNLASSAGNRGQDDEENSEGSTTVNYGLKVNGSQRHNASLSFSREPLDLPTWSNVTSPGFTSRLVQQASDHSPLKEFNDSLSHSPFRKSPYNNLALGELPYVNFSRKPKLSSASFSGSQRSYRSVGSSSSYSRDRRRHARQGQVYVRITPIDFHQANVTMSRKSSSPPVAMGAGGPYPPRGSPRAGSESYHGLGGIPQQELAMRFNRMWPPSPGGSVPGPGRPSSPTAPSNILEALTSGRKRGREQEPYYPPNATPPSSPPPKISIGIGDTPVRPQMPKRVKFLGAPEGHDRPMMVPYAGLGAGDGEPLSSESILEQMNQTEKRFLPDSTSTPYANKKGNSRMSGCGALDEQSPTLHNALRKRRSPAAGVLFALDLDEETRSEKSSRFCRCNDCYAEAAGLSINTIQSKRSPSSSPNKSNEKTGDNASPSKQTCDIGVGTDPDKRAIFRELFKHSDRSQTRQKDETVVGRDREVLKLDRVVLTKEMYNKDKQKRIERYYRLLQLKPPGGTIFDINLEPKSSITNDSSQRKNGDEDVTDSPAKPGLSFAVGGSTTSAAPIVTGTTTTPGQTVGFGFGQSNAETTSTTSSSTTTNGGFSFGSPIQTTNTNTLSFGNPAPTSTISNPAPTTTTSAGFSFGSTVQTTNANVNEFSFGKPAPTPTTSPPAPTTTASDGFSFGSTIQTTSASDFAFCKPTPTPITSTPAVPTTTTSAGFSFGSTVQTTNPNANEFSFGKSAPPPTTSPPAPTTTASGGFSFGSTIQTTSASANDFSFGNTAPAATTTPTTALTIASPSTIVNTSPPPAFGSIATSPQAPAGSSGSIFGGSISTTTTPTTFSFGSITVSAPQQSTPSQGGFSFASNSQQPTTASSGFGFGQSNPNSQPPPTTSTGTTGAGIFQFGQQAPSTTTGFGFGAPPQATSPGGFSFGKQTSSAAPTMAGPTSTAITSPSSNSAPPAFGSVVSPSGATSLMGSSTANPGFAFGASAMSPPQQSNPGQGATGGFSFGKQTSSVAPTMAGPTSTPTAITSPSSGSAPPAFGSSSSGASFFLGSSTANPGFSFGGSSMSPPQQSTPAQGAGGFSFGKQVSSVAPTMAGPTSTAITSPSSNSAPPAFGSVGSPSGTASFLGSSTANPGFGFGGSAMPQQSNPAPTTGAFSFGNGSQPSSTPFAFGQGGQTNPTTSQQPTATPTPGIFQFGQQAAAPAPGGFNFNTATPAASMTGGQPMFNMGTSATAPNAGVFNFNAAAPPAGMTSGGGQPMFNVGTSSTAPRRRDGRRRYR